MKIINHRKKEIKPLTSKENKFTINQTAVN